MRTTVASLRKGRFHHFHHFVAVLWHWNEIVRAGDYYRRIFCGTHATTTERTEREVAPSAPQHSSTRRLADANFIIGALVVRPRPRPKFQSIKQIIPIATNRIKHRRGTDVAGGIIKLKKKGRKVEVPGVYTQRMKKKMSKKNR